MEVAKPIIRKIDDTPESLKIFEEDLCSYSDENVQEIITSYPTVYIHNWKESDEYEVYIGESNNVIQRTRQHYETGLYNANSWQNRITGKSAALYIIGHEHFNKSMTLDVENRLMHYMLSVPKVRKVHNLRGNPQNHYYPMEELDRIFSKIWRGLRKDNKDLFPTESMIHDSAIFKASPLHKLTKEQLQARDKIIERVKMALSIGAAGQLIFVEGEAGTGKTVHFYEKTGTWMVSKHIISRKNSGGKPDYTALKLDWSLQQRTAGVLRFVRTDEAGKKRSYLAHTVYYQ